MVLSAYKEQRFDSLIPEVISDMETDVEYQEMITRTAERGQAALTRDENDKRQAVLSELDIVPWQRKMKVCVWSSHTQVCRRTPNDACSSWFYLGQIFRTQLSSTAPAA